MGKSSEELRKRLTSAFEAKNPSKMELHKATKIARNSIDGYLAGAVPDLDALDAIGEALGLDPWKLIRPEDESIPEVKRSLIDFILAMNEEEATLFLPGTLEGLKVQLRAYRGEPFRPADSAKNIKNK